MSKAKLLKNSRNLITEIGQKKERGDITKVIRHWKINNSKLIE